MFEKITDNVEIHQTLPDTPNLTTQELKIKWDKGCKIIKEAFNKLIDKLNDAKIISTVLYKNSEGTTDNITLNDEIENYNSFEVESYTIYTGVKVYVNTGRLSLDAKERIHINNLFVGSTGELTVYNKRISISSKNLTVNSDRVLNNNGMAEGSYTYITKVVGYK